MAKLLAPFVLELAAAKKAEDRVEEPPPEQLPDLEDGEDAPDPPNEDGAEPDGSSPDDTKTEPAPRPPEPEPPPPPEDPEAPTETTSPADEARDALRRAVGLIAWDQAEFEEILLLDPEGRVFVSTFEEHERHSASEVRYFEKGRSGTYLEPVYLSPLTGELTMVISTPLLDKDRKFLGVLAARLNLKRFFRLVIDSTGLGETGETVVGRVEGSEVVFTAPTRHVPEAALQTRVALGGATGRAIQEAAVGHTGFGREVDYRGEVVLAAWQNIPSLEWGLVAKIDRAEAMQPIEEARSVAVVAAGGLLILGVLLATLVSRRFVRPLRDLQRAAERISRGTLDVSLDITSRDEIGELADSFERMVAAIKFFREHSRRPEDDPDEDMLEREPAGAASPSGEAAGDEA
jgi:HAMP domain-containing protein